MQRLYSLAYVLIALTSMTTIIGNSAIAATPSQKQAAGRAFAAAGRGCSAVPSDMVLIDMSGRREVYQTIVNGTGKTKTCIAVCESNSCTVQ